MEMPENRNRRSESREGRHGRSPAWKCRETEAEDPSPVRDGIVGARRGNAGNRNRRSQPRQGRHSRSPAWECREIRNRRSESRLGTAQLGARHGNAGNRNQRSESRRGRHSRSRHGNARKPKLCSFGQRSNSSSARMIESREGRHNREPGMEMPGTETEDPSPVRDGTVGARHGNAGKPKPKIRVP